MTPIELLDETVEYYKTHKRGLKPCAGEYSTTQCVYFYRNAKCAVGRCMINPKKFKNVIATASEVFDGYNIETILKPEYVNIDRDVFYDLQQLHDKDEYWIETKRGNKLTREGIEQYNTLKQAFKKYEN